MSPYLTARGKWLFVTGALFGLLGALVQQPLLILFAQVPLAVLVFAVAQLMTPARAVDRRAVTFVVEQDGAESGVIRLVRDETREFSFWLENGSQSVLLVASLVGHTEGFLQTPSISGRLRVEAGTANEFLVAVTSTGIGRASLQGFDITLVDRWGVVAVHDYLPCLQVFETAPAMGARRGRLVPGQATVDEADSTTNSPWSTGMDLRELREYQPGDPLRSIAWKATARQRRLIAREFDDERDHVDHVALDISSSMRAGTPPGEKFDHAIDLTASICATVLGQGRRVGLYTFTESLYGELPPQRGLSQGQRIQRHLMELRSVVAPGYTSLDDEALEEALADYLLIQERLDFRRGGGLRGPVDRDLLRRWIDSRMPLELARWEEKSSLATRGEDPGLVREFCRHRAVELRPPSEIPAGAKLAGVEAVFRSVLNARSEGGTLTIITDLCGVGEPLRLKELLKLAARRRLRVRLLVPFTPAYGHQDPTATDKAGIVREIFARAELSDRLVVVEELRAMGAQVEVVGPHYGMHRFSKKARAQS